MSVVKAYSGEIVLPTYPLGPEDREPPLRKEFTPRGTEIYPYTSQEIISAKAEVRAYEARYLENDYLKLTFLPALNGRLYSARDKVNNHELFYANSSIKPGLFAVRGAWVAAGVEFNFPDSHTASTLEPAHIETRRHDDGAASILVGNIDMTSRMVWSAETVLYPNSSAIHMESKLYNPTDIPHRFYYWVNAACPVYGDSEFIFPPSTRKLLTHPPMDASRLAKLNYPVHYGTDIRFFKNIKQHFPVFAEKMQDDFFGLYHHRKDHGVVHVADRAMVRGRKFWTFGNARDGRIFIDQLSDSSVDYCELQTGPFSLQSDYRLLWPGRMYSQRESWFPVARTGGFNFACREFAARIMEEGGRVKVGLCATKKLRNIVAAVISNGQEVSVSSFDAEPCRLVELSLCADSPDKIIFRDAGRRTLAVFFFSTTSETENPEDARSSVFGPPSVKGRYLEEQGETEQAKLLYEKNADRDAACALGAARLAFASGCFKEAEEKTCKLSRIESANPELLILRGLLQYRNGNLTEAENAFSRAADDNRYRDRALFYLAYCATSARAYRRALENIDEMRRFGIADERTLRLQAFCLERLGIDNSRIKVDAQKMFSFVPLMEQVCEFISLRHFAEAKDLLEKAEDSQAVLGQYYLGWLNHMMGQETAARRQLNEAAGSAWSGPFSFRLEDEPVFRYALGVNPGDDNANYQLACLLASRMRWEEAAPFWMKVRGPQYKTDAKRNLALYYWKVIGDRKKASEYFREAAFAEDAGSRTILEAEIFFGETAQHCDQLSLFRKKDKLIERDSRIKLALIRTMLDNNQPEKAFELLVNANFQLCEGKKLSRHLYEQACANIAEKAENRGDYETALKFYLKASEYPENLGIGKPSGNMEARWYFGAGNACLKLGKEEEATQHFLKGAEKGDWIDIDFFPLKKVAWEADWEKIDAAYWKNIYYRARCLEFSGRKHEATVLMNRFRNYLRSLERSHHPQKDTYLELKKLL